MIRSLTAVVGALVVFIGVFFLCGMLITPFLPEIFRIYIHIGNVGTNNPVGVILGLIAAASSFFATLRSKR